MVLFSRLQCYLRNVSRNSSQNRPESIMLFVHDLNNRLSDLSSYLRGLMKKAQRDKIKEMLSKAKNTCNEIKQFMQNHQSTLLRGHFSTPKIIELDSLMLTLKDRYGREARKRKITISYSSPDEPKIYLLASETELSTAFYNIIHNDLKSMDNGGNLEIVVTIDDEGQKVKVIITDEGKGMTEETIEALTDGRYRHPDGRSAMGFSSAKFVIEHHGGSVNIKSKVDKGTTVSLVVPIRKEVNHE